MGDSLEITVELIDAGFVEQMIECLSETGDFFRDIACLGAWLEETFRAGEDRLHILFCELFRVRCPAFKRIEESRDSECMKPALWWCNVELPLLIVLSMSA